MNGKRKGDAYERKVASMFREYGYQAKNNGMYGQFSGLPDVSGVPYIHVECKKTEKIRVYDFMNQSIADAGNKIPIVVTASNYKDDLVIMRFEDWMKLYKEFEVNSVLDFREDR